MSNSVPSGGESVGGPHRGALRMSPGSGLASSLLAGVAVWGVLEATLPVFKVPEEYQNLSGNVPLEKMQEMLAWISLVTTRNAMFALAILAFGVGLVLTAVEHVTRRCPVQGLLGGLLAALLALPPALGAAAVGARLMELVDLPDHRLIKTMIVQGGMFGLLGLGLGLAIALAMFRHALWKTVIPGCFLGGLLAAFLFPILAATLIPDMSTEFLVPDAGVGRLLWVALASCSIGLTVTGLGKDKPQKPAKVDAASPQASK